MNGYTVSRTFDSGFAVRLGSTGQVVAILGSEVDVVRYMVAHEVVTTEEKMAQWSTAVQINTESGVLSADVICPTPYFDWFRIMIGGVILSPCYDSIVDAIDAAEAILWRLAEGANLVEPMPDEESDFSGETLPTGWDAADHKALYE